MKQRISPHSKSRARFGTALLLLGAVGALGCSTSNPATSAHINDVDASVRNTGATTPRAIEHVVIVVQENHTFDNYFGTYCTAPTGSNPTCTDGPACCEAAPATEPSGAAPIALDDAANANFDPDHSYGCEITELNGGAMDRFVSGAACSRAENFAVASPTTMTAYANYAKQYALADRYFQPLVGQSSANDMYLAVAKFVFSDNELSPDSPGKACSATPIVKYTGQKTVADVMTEANHSIKFYAEGWDEAKRAGAVCATPASACPLQLGIYPCVFDPSDIPFLYYAQHADDPAFMRDYTQLASDVAAGSLPDVAFVKAYGFRTEHPGYGTTLSDGVTFVGEVVSSVLGGSKYKDNTLVLLAWDEGGGYFDHVTPPAVSAIDGKPYGTRIPMIAVGPFARQNFVSHVTMEHASIVKFLEWNFTGATGQLGARDTVANNIGSLLDPSKLTTPVPEK